MGDLDDGALGPVNPDALPRPVFGTDIVRPDQIADDVPGFNIIETQNNRDWERSYECVEKALEQGGYSCYARNHLGHWFNELGGSASTPWCEGMVKTSKGPEIEGAEVEITLDDEDIAR